MMKFLHILTVLLIITSSNCRFSKVSIKELSKTIVQEFKECKEKEFLRLKDPTNNFNNQMKVNRCLMSFKNKLKLLAEKNNILKVIYKKFYRDLRDETFKELRIFKHKKEEGVSL